MPLVRQIFCCVFSVLNKELTLQVSVNAWRGKTRPLGAERQLQVQKIKTVICPGKGECLMAALMFGNDNECPCSVFDLKLCRLTSRSRLTEAFG